MFSLLGKNFAFVPFCMAWTSRRVELERVFEIDGTPCCVMNGDGFVALLMMPMVSVGRLDYFFLACY